MKGVELYARVRYAVQIEGVSRREAARRYGIDPRTVAKMLAFSVPPGYRRSRPPARPKLDPFTGIIDGILAEDEGRPRKQRHTSKRIFERLRDEHGYAGGITIVKDYVLARRLRQREVFVPLRHDPGHAQVDFGEALAEIAGVERKIHFFAMDLPHSDACFVQAYPAETTEAFCDGHNAAFGFFGKVPQLDPLRQHEAGGGAHPGRRGAAADASVQRAAIALPVCRPVRPARQGQRQGQGRGAGRLDPPEPAGAGAAGGQLDGAERAAARGLSPPARRSAARSRRDDRRTAGAGSGGVPRLAAGALRRLREEGGPGQLAVAGALSRHRLLGADRLRPPRGSDPRLRPRGGDLLRGRGDRPPSALLRARGLRLRPAALPGVARAARSALSTRQRRWSAGTCPRNSPRCAA